MKNFLLALMMVPLALNAQIDCDNPNGIMQQYICQNLEDTQTILALEGDLADLQQLLLDAQASIDSLNAVNDSLIAAQDCGYEQFVIDELLTANLELNADLTECDSVAQAEVEYWMDNYYGAVAEGKAMVDSLQAIISAVPASIEVAADNAYAQGLEDCADAANEACLELLNDAYDGGVADGISYMEDEVLPVLLVQEYDLGYNAGLADCEGEVAGIVDIDGTVINVIGYYNQLGQVIDPATATGVIIRKHEAGTFSKYFR